MPIAFSVLQKQNHNILIQIFVKCHVCRPVSKSFTLPCSILTSIHFDLTTISLQMTIVFGTNKKRNVYILVHTCVKFNDHRQFLQSFVLPFSVLTSVHFDLTAISLQMTIVFGAIKLSNHFVLIYICAKFHTCSLICSILCV